MTEQKSLYHAHSGTLGPTSPHSISASQSLVQHYADGTTARDTILLLPILVSPLSHGQPSRCLYSVHLDNGDPSFCNRSTDDVCACCTVPVCTEHSRLVYTLVPEIGDDPAYEDMVFCETCAVLSPSTRVSLHAFIVQINAPQEAAHEIIHHSTAVEHPATLRCQRGNCPWDASRRVTIEITQEMAFPTALSGLIFPSHRATFDLCSGCYHFNVKRDNALQIVSVAPLEWPDTEVQL